MNLKLRNIVVAAVVALASPTLMAQSNHQGHNHADHAHSQATAGPHGGAVRQSRGVQLETVVTQGGIQLFVYDAAGQPVSVTQGRGAASLRVAGNAKRYRYDLLPDGKGGLTAPVNLSKIAGRQIELDIQLVGIPGANGRVTFMEVASVPPSEEQLAAAAIVRQNICPVSGKPLGSMGQPIKVMIGDKSVFLCCKGCVKKIKAEPAKYLAMVYPEETGVKRQGLTPSAENEKRGR